MEIHPGGQRKNRLPIKFVSKVTLVNINIKRCFKWFILLTFAALMDAVKKLTFKKEERLTSKKLFEQLFEGGQALFSHPIKLQFVEVPVTENPFPVQVAFVVSKRNFKNAVDRNRIKRQMREVYRLNKTALYEKCQLRNKNLALLFIYVAKTKSDFKLIEKKMILLMKELMVDKQVS